MIMAAVFIAYLPSDANAQNRRRRANRPINTEAQSDNASAAVSAEPVKAVQPEPAAEPEPIIEPVPEQPAQFSYVEEDSSRKSLTPSKKISLKERITFTAIYSQIEMGGEYDEYWGERVNTLTDSGWPYEVEKSSAAYGIGLEYGITERFGIGTDLIYFGKSKWLQHGTDYNTGDPKDHYAEDTVLSANLYLKFNIINWRLFKYLSLQAYGKAGGGYYVRNTDYSYYKPSVTGSVTGSSFGYSYGGGADLSFGKKGGFVLGAEYMFYKANDEIHVNRFSGQSLPAFEAALVNFHAGIRFGGKPEIENEEAEF